MNRFTFFFFGLTNMGQHILLAGAKIKKILSCNSQTDIVSTAGTISFLALERIVFPVTYRADFKHISF